MVKDAKAAAAKGGASKLIKEMAAFPFLYDRTGRCSMLGQDNKCTIYDQRPLVCNVKGLHRMYFHQLSEAEFYKINEEVCAELQEQDLNDKNEQGRT